MSKQDRQPPRTAVQLEQKYNFGQTFENTNLNTEQIMSMLNRHNQSLAQLTQSMSQFMADTNAKIATLEEAIETIKGDDEPSTNLLPMATDENGDLFVGDNDEKGYIYGYRVSVSKGILTENSGAFATGFMEVSQSDTIYIKNVSLSLANASGINNIGFYDSSKTYIYGNYILTQSCVKVDGNNITIPVNELYQNENIAYFRFSCAGIYNGTVVTIQGGDIV